MWVGTLDQGLQVFMNGRWGAVGPDQGLFDNRVYAILEDGNDNLWMSSERGIFCARKSELEKAVFDPTQKVQRTPVR